MKLSELQKYILKQAWQSESKTAAKGVLEKFYDFDKRKPKDIISIITKSVDRLIKKDLVAGYGHKTAKKWFISQVRLTTKGRKTARNLFGIQQKLPFKKR